MQAGDDGGDGDFLNVQGEGVVDGEVLHDLTGVTPAPEECIAALLYASSVSHTAGTPSTPACCAGAGEEGHDGEEGYEEVTAPPHASGGTQNKALYLCDPSLDDATVADGRR